MPIHPAFLYFFAAAIIPLLSDKARKLTQLLLPLVAAGLLSQILSINPETPVKSVITVGLFDFTLIKADTLAIIFAGIFILFSLLANLYALNCKYKYVHIAANIYVGSSIGAVLAGDLVTLFIFWEIMAIASACLIWNSRRPHSMQSLYRYVLLHGAGGLCFFTGILIKLIAHESLHFGALQLDIAGILIFVSFAINAGLPPVHAWLPDAYPAGRAEASIYLCTFTTKVAVYAFARGFSGSEILLWLGVAAAIYGVIYALMENDIRKLLSYHIICQVGYMVIGIGLGAHLGVNGGIGHAIGNILFKGLLFMSAGAIMQMTSHTKLSELGGLYSTAKWILVFHMLGAFSIAGLPFLNGYVSKSLLVAAAGYKHLGWLELTLMIVAVGTFMSIGLKLTYFAFFHKNTVYKQLHPLPWNCYAAMALTAAACLAIGVYPELLYRFLPYPVKYNIFTIGHILQTLQMLAGTYFGFCLIRKFLHTKDAITLDFDWFYRLGGSIFVKGICIPLKLGQETIQAGWTHLIEKTNHTFERLVPGQKINTVAIPLLLMICACLFMSLFLILRPY